MGAKVHILDELTERGFIKQASDAEGLRKAMDEGNVPFYVGFDPTASSLHIGSLLQILFAYHLQAAGHTAHMLVGGGTAYVGDPSGKTELRKMMTPQTIAEHKAGVAEQLGRFVTLDGEKGLLVDNADWLLGLNYIDFLREIGSRFSVNRMLAAESYKQRLERGLSFIELNYQILQAYDFHALNERHGVRLQLGGDDQWGNIVAGIDLCRRMKHDKGQDPEQVFALTTPLITTATGAKMGKTAKGAVWLDAKRTSPFDFFQYWLNVDDRDVVRFLKLYTLLPLSEIAELAKLTGADIRTAKRRLAREITILVHGQGAADEAEAAGKAMASGKASADMPSWDAGTVPADGLTVVDALAGSGLLKSKGEARRMIKGGAVRVDGVKISDQDAALERDQVLAGCVIRVGKKRAIRVTGT